MNETFIPAFDYTQKKWYVIDCKDKQLGRISTTIVGLLAGKIKSYYHPAFDTGDYVILINAESLTVDRNLEQIRVFRPGRPGSSLKRLTNDVPQRIIERCIFGMMPNGIAKKSLAKRLKVYQGSEHPHQAQNPIYIDDINNFKNNL
jgi:large subunit ribosomal protein L13